MADKTAVNWDEVAEYAVGTPHSEAAIAATFDLDQEDEDRIGEELEKREISNCVEGCGWWFNMDEMESPDLCTECYVERLDD